MQSKLPDLKARVGSQPGLKEKFKRYERKIERKLGRSPALRPQHVHPKLGSGSSRLVKHSESDIHLHAWDKTESFKMTHTTSTMVTSQKHLKTQ